MMRERLLLLGKLLSPLPVADDGASSLLILGPNMIDHYPLLLSLLPGWNLNFSLEAITSLFIGINLTLFRFVSLFKLKKKTRRNSFQVRFFIQSKKKNKKKKFLVENT
jgi:hypothetical protein